MEKCNTRTVTLIVSNNKQPTNRIASYRLRRRLPHNNILDTI